jgi:hypothetical protein
MSSSSTIDQAKERSRDAILCATKKWHPLIDGFPKSGELVWVRMVDGRVVAGRWNTAARKWEHATGEKWGMPSYWAAVEASRTS